MKKLFIYCLLLLFSLTQSFPLTAKAYTYGDPNEEALAEVYKKMLIELDKNPPDYAIAEKHYNTVKEEVDMHMGPEPSKVILQDLENEDKDKVIKDMDQLLVLNIARRLDNTDKNFSEYETSKRLLAKGFATYEALSPKIEARNPETDKEIKSEFDKALNSLGNPGLFGVGQKEADKNAFDASKDKIFSLLQKEFGLKSLKVGHFNENSTNTSTQNNDWTDVSNLKNWLPLVVIVVILGAVVIFTVRKKKKS
ncbi:hypothetical protein [Cytobacillus dafuensis]|uniref:Extracellular protein n=1 Tax=Cytobacillus dafuensis TaxID=1742359 RepID=A0A5B8Z357_CYTDA|nr:hypothetical protein [Cytobacillus dafuensis]QED46039.1 hypothetical protein FSZ17_01245 [Cytobacillus dafuensis]